MKHPMLLLAFVPFVLTACDETAMNSTGGGGVVSELPEAVLELAAPYQNLTTVRINEADGCYEYLHNGPVEATYLPLRATNGRPICTRAPGEEAPAKS